ncbi:MAG TPA: sensor histidine kinase [Burkholderiales bacterium]|nr:sensor histidine kinase [Burkholderiales bacterium]
MDMDTDVIRAEPHAEIGSLLQRNANAIVDRWCKAARDETTAAQRVHQVVLRDDLPAFLDAMGRALAQAGRPDSEPVSNAKQHGSQRWDSGWSVTELVRDYQLLRLVVLEFLEENLARPLYYREALAVGVFIDDAIAASIARYVADRDEHLRRIDAERVQVLSDLSRRKDEFLAILGHELRNPLAPIRNSVEVMRRLLDQPHPAVASSLDVLDRQSQQLCRLVDDLLDLARISRGEFELRMTRFDVRTAIEQALQMTEPLIATRQHRLDVAMPAAPLYLNADPSRITQIVANLLTNAAKYTEPGGKISLAVEAEGTEVVIRVRDNGIGISPDMLSRVFELFARVDQPQTGGLDGLGIGLTLVQRLAQQHGGSITANSAGLGHGAEFTVRLPTDFGADADSLETKLVIRPVRR